MSSSTTGLLSNTNAAFGPGVAGSACAGEVNVGRAEVAPVSVTAGPDNCRHEYVSAVTDREPSRATVRPRTTVWSTPASAVGRRTLIASTVTVVGMPWPPGPATASVNAYAPTSVGTNVAVAVSAPVSVTAGPDVWVHAYESISPVEPVPSRRTVWPRMTGVWTVAAATGAAGRNA